MLQRGSRNGAGTTENKIREEEDGQEVKAERSRRKEEDAPNFCSKSQCSLGCLCLFFICSS
jgi:hypothetical protein